MTFPARVRSMAMTYIDVNGLSLYYEEHGTANGGTPLIMLHGGFGTGDMFGDSLPVLAEDRWVVTADLQGHGRTADIDRPLRFETMADDIAALIRHLGTGQADVLGLSLGGGVALRLAIQHPELVRRLVLMSQPCRWDGWFPEVRAGFTGLTRAIAEQFKQAPWYAVYEKVAPRPEQWPDLIDKIGRLLVIPYDWSAQAAQLTMPVMLIYGDADSVTPAHITEFWGLLGGGQRDGNWDGSLRPASRLAILPGQVHTTIWTAPEMPALVGAFLAADPLIPPPLM